MFDDIIQRVEFFKDKPKDFLRKIFKLFKPIFLSQGEEVYHQGQAANEIYFIIQGRVISKFKLKDDSYKSLVVVEGSYFGEVDIILHRERIEAAFATVKCEIWKIDK
jgi:CRP-like cAMP-binding protein